MGCTKYTAFRVLDVVFLTAVFILQSVILSQYTVYSQYHAEMPSDYVNPIFQKLLWLTGDFICLAAFLLACLCGFKHVSKKRNLQKSRAQLNDLPESARKVEQVGDHRFPEEQLNKNSIVGYIASSRIPLCYISWFLYAALLVIKITVIFTSDLSKKWRVSEINHEKIFFGPQVLQMGIGLSAVIFSLLVEAHHNAGKEDPKRNAYLKSISYEVALEILDTACLLSFLISSFDHDQEHAAHGEVCPSIILTPPIITLSAANLILPTVTLYKLTSTNFGESYHVKLEMSYKTLHLLLVNIPFLAIRIHLWDANDREDVLFLIKNIYGIVGYFRGVYSDVHILRKERQHQQKAAGDTKSNGGRKEDSMVNVNNRRRGNEDEEGRSDSIEMNRLM